MFKLVDENIEYVFKNLIVARTGRFMNNDIIANFGKNDACHLRSNLYLGGKWSDKFLNMIINSQQMLQIVKMVCFT